MREDSGIAVAFDIKGGFSALVKSCGSLGISYSFEPDGCKPFEFRQAQAAISAQQGNREPGKSGQHQGRNFNQGQRHPAHHHELYDQREQERAHGDMKGFLCAVLFPLAIPAFHHQRRHHNGECVNLQFGVEGHLQPGQHKHDEADQHAQKAHTRHAQFEQRRRGKHADPDRRYQHQRTENRADLQEGYGNQHRRKQAERFHADKTPGKHHQECANGQGHQQV
ncbi:hypothetical protein AAV99_03175 [Aurantiacibacter marinus]|uniref:Uncharacterized protein n=1 Tax=Aurantiacibacter marinus TaxID=874156 RepID=A0A0H0XQF8_9SPHN|nr:hypothetical protein AAV99_03175 [Aurantiacibacter marinus]